MNKMNATRADIQRMPSYERVFYIRCYQEQEEKKSDSM